MKILIYSTPTCHYCNLAKEYFKSKHLEYETVDLVQNPERGQEMIQLTGQMGVPVIRINEKTIIGFNKEAIERAIAEDARL